MPRLGRRVSLKTSQPSKSWDLPDVIVVAAAGSAGTNRAPPVTAYTNIARASSVAVDQVGIDAGHRLRSARLPENMFNPFLSHPRKHVAVSRGLATASGIQVVASATNTVSAVQDIQHGVDEALDRWALLTSRRESLLLWRHECSRYASSSRIGYHPNHPSAIRPGSRPSSAATIVRPFSAGCSSQQRASSAVPLQSQTHESRGVAGRDRVDKQGNIRPRSAISRLGDSSQPTEEVYGDLAPRPRRGASASGRGVSSGGGSSGGMNRGRGDRDSRGGGSSSRRLSNPQDALSLGGQEEELYEEIYEDLDEDDGELDNRISIMENRFSTVGRERPASSVNKLDEGLASTFDNSNALQRSQEVSTALRSARRPPRAYRQASSLRATRRNVSADVDGPTRGLAVSEIEHPISCNDATARKVHIFKSRPTSAPAGGSFFYEQRSNDPIADLYARRMRLLSADAGDHYLVRGGGTQEQGCGQEARIQHQHQQQRQQDELFSRDVTTPVLSWDRDVDGGDRPLSSVTMGVIATAAGDATATGEVGGVSGQELTEPSQNQSRPSSAAFQRWLKARPGARSAISAISSARMLGMDDPELVHLQVEMESRRGVMSETTLAQMEDYYSAVVLKNEKSLRPSSGDQAKQGRSTSPQKNSSTVGGNKNSGKGTPTSSSGKSSPKKSPRKGKTRKGSTSSSPRKKKKGGKRSPKKGKTRGKNSSTRAVSSTIPRKVYPSARAFMVNHFPAEERQSLSLLGMEQEEECRNVSEALSRYGVLISRNALHRALVIPTDRPLEACLAGLPVSKEGLRDKPFPIPPPLPTIATIVAVATFRQALMLHKSSKLDDHHPQLPHLSSWGCYPADSGGATTAAAGNGGGDGNGRTEQQQQRDGKIRGRSRTDKKNSSSLSPSSPKRSRSKSPRRRK